MGYVLIALYLLVIVVANQIVAHYGQPALAVTAWVLIPFDMTLRSVLQRRWEGDRLVLRMGGLILAGSALSAVVNTDAVPIAVASFSAFFVAGTGEAVTFNAARHQHRLLRVNAANVVAAVLDSLVFQAVAFGNVEPLVFASQSMAKLLGGGAWSLVLVNTIWKWTAKAEDRP
jgi:hypothetical protein